MDSHTKSLLHLHSDPIRDTRFGGCRHPFVDWNCTVTHAVANYKKGEALKITFRVSRFPATTLGQRIRKCRLEHGLKQVELAALLGVNPRTIVNWEKDRARPRSGEMKTVVQSFLKGRALEAKKSAKPDNRKTLLAYAGRSKRID